MPGFEPDDEASGPPPHPLDRTWLHPSELAAALRPGSPSAPRTERGPASGRRRDTLLALGAGAVGALTTVGLLALFGAFARDTPDPERAAAPERAAPGGAAAIAARVQPGIAAVATMSAAGTRRGSAIALDDHDLLTTGDVVDPDGADQQIMVGTHSGSMSVATVRAADAVTNLVIIHVPGIRFRPPTWRDADTVRPGDAVVAVGRTSANAPWVSNGVVTETSGWATDASGRAHAGMFATDTADQLLATGRASHGALGVEAQDSPTGPVVVRVARGSSAAAAALRAGDRIRAIDGVRTPDTSGLVYELRRRRAGTTVTLTLTRSGRTLRIRARLDDAASTPAATGGMTPLAVDRGS